MNNGVAGLLALAGIAYYMVFRNAKKKVDAHEKELKAENEKVVTETTPVNHDD